MSKIRMRIASRPMLALMDELLLVDRTDPRIGVSWLTTRQLAERFGSTDEPIRLRLRARGLSPVARIGRNGAYLFELSALRACGEVPDRSFDPATELWFGDYARERGYECSTHLLIALCARLGAELGQSAKATRDQLEESGIARRLGGRWAVKRAAADALLAPPYDPQREATLEQLRPEFPFSNAANLARALRGHVPARRVVDVDGRPRLVFEIAAVREFFAGRHATGRRVSRSSPEVVRPQETWRSHVGPFELQSPTRQEEISATQASWLLQEDSRVLLTPAARAVRSARSGETRLTIGAVEAALHERGDLEGLLLLALILDGALVVTHGLDRTAALLASLEKAA